MGHRNDKSLCTLRVVAVAVRRWQRIKLELYEKYKINTTIYCLLSYSSIYSAPLIPHSALRWCMDVECAACWRTQPKTRRNDLSSLEILRRRRRFCGDGEILRNSKWEKKKTERNMGNVSARCGVLCDDGYNTSQIVTLIKQFETSTLWLIVSFFNKNAVSNAPKFVSSRVRLEANLGPGFRFIFGVTSCAPKYEIKK